MGKHVNSKSRTFRLPVALLEKMESEAAASDMTMNELAKRRLWTSFFGARGNRKPSESGHKAFPGDDRGVFDG